MNENIRVTVWGEDVRNNKKAKGLKNGPCGMHEIIADALRECDDLKVRTATLDMPEHGLTEDVLNKTDVLIWWGHSAHSEVGEKIVDRVCDHVLEGMGLVVLHSGHYAKIFKRLLGVASAPSRREADKMERVWVCNPSHPIAQGIDRYFELRQEEMYGEPFVLANPDEIVFLSWFEGGEVRAGCTWKRGKGKIFYFRPGHKNYPTYQNKEVRRVIQNAVRWARPEGRRWMDPFPSALVEKTARRVP